VVNIRGDSFLSKKNGAPLNPCCRYPNLPTRISFVLTNS
jgi:hypothetical protein